MSRPWTPEEDALLKARFSKTRTAVLARELGRSHASVQRRAWQLGLSGEGFTPWTDADEALLRDLYASTPTQELAEMLGKTPQAVTTRACRMGLKKNGRHRNGGRAWTPEDDELLRECVKTMSASGTAGRLRRTVNSVLTRASRLGLRFVGPKKRFEDEWPPELEERLRAGAEEGKSLSLIADAVGKSVTAVLKALRRLGIERAELSKTKPWGRPRGSRTKKKRYQPRHPNIIPEGWISSKEAEPIVGVGRKYIGKLCRSGKLEGRKVGQGCWIVLRESAERYAEERKAELERQLAERLSASVEKKRKPAQSAPKRRKPEPRPQPDFMDETQVESMSKLDILRAIASGKMEAPNAG
jgi:hypothetical protein